MNMFLLNILLAVTWGMATGTFTVPNLAFGFALGYLILSFSQRVLGPSPYFAKVRLLVRFAVRYIWELVLANFRVAYDVLVPGATPPPVAGRGKVSPPGLPPERRVRPIRPSRTAFARRWRRSPTCARGSSASPWTPGPMWRSPCWRT